MSKEYVVQGAMCMCKFGTTPAILKVPDNDFLYMNGKLTATTLTLGNVFQPPGFGVCKFGIFSKPCIPAITQWSGYCDEVSINGNSFPLTDSSKGTCAAGSPACIDFKTTGQVPIPGPSQIKAEFEETDDEPATQTIETATEEQEENVVQKEKQDENSSLEEEEEEEEKKCFCRELTVELFDQIFNKATIFAASNMKKRTEVYQLEKQKLIDALNNVAQRYNINNCLRLAHFLGQIAHESDNFKTTEEYASGSAYEGRKDLGNTQKGDGIKFKGRGLIQLTGRSNYEKYTNYVKSKFGETKDFTIEPDIIASNIDYAVDVAGWYWSVARNINLLADEDEIDAVTRAINGGKIGLTDRENKTNKAKNVLDYQNCNYINRTKEKE